MAPNFELLGFPNISLPQVNRVIEILAGRLPRFPVYWAETDSFPRIAFYALRDSQIQIRLIPVRYSHLWPSFFSFLFLILDVLF